MSIPPFVSYAICTAAPEMLRVDASALFLPRTRRLGFLLPYLDMTKISAELARLKSLALNAGKRYAFALLSMSGLPFVIRELFQRNRVTVLSYHSISAAKADAHLALLKSKYNIISLNSYLDARKSGKLNKLPRKAMVITLDDGWKSNLQLLPVLRKHGVTATVFLCSDFHKREAALPYERKRFLSRDDIDAMRAYVDFQAHTVGHARLPYVSTEEALYQVTCCKRDLEGDLGLTIRSIAFPNGDYSDRDMAIAAAAGYECALTGDRGFNTAATSPFGMRRICIQDDAELEEVVAKSCGLWGFIRSLLVKQSYGYVRGRESTPQSSRRSIYQSE